ncbi:hypothetical protein L195_g021715 [Trifolium pratense]|uniref:Uncharacterized protein n=1 Tax=Trifolium pratense TaxID=57577 RepID=A0A2K3LJ42_TRIPR|nr:hypothetical protein L195_g034524 [Trifolium pratense]PNX98467.1 hypothetical protein L195_g021715 [Trifolium pratense]
MRILISIVLLTGNGWNGLLAMILMRQVFLERLNKDEYYARWAQMKTTISADSNIDDDMSSEDE